MGQERVFQMNTINQECEFKPIKLNLLKADQFQFSKESKPVENITLLQYLLIIFLDWPTYILAKAPQKKICGSKICIWTVYRNIWIKISKVPCWQWCLQYSHFQRNHNSRRLNQQFYWYWCTSLERNFWAHDKDCHILFPKHDFKHYDLLDRLHHNIIMAICNKIGDWSG